jgi:hypothetical protein
MIRIITDSGVESTLLGVTEPAEIRRSSGELLGFFCPASPESARLYAAAAATLSPAEVAKRKQAHDAAASTAEVLDRLQRLSER